MTTYEATAGPVARSTDDKSIALLNYVLLLLGFFTSGITSLVAVVLAYARRSEADPMARSHLDFQISTFWIGFIGTTVGILMMLGMIAPLIMLGINEGDVGRVGEDNGPAVAAVLLGVGGVLVLIATAVATLVRSIYGLIKLASDRPMGGR